MSAKIISTRKNNVNIIGGNKFKDMSLLESSKVIKKQNSSSISSTTSNNINNNNYNNKKKNNNNINENISIDNNKSNYIFNEKDRVKPLVNISNQWGNNREQLRKGSNTTNWRKYNENNEYNINKKMNNLKLSKSYDSNQMSKKNIHDGNDMIRKSHDEFPKLNSNNVISKNSPFIFELDHNDEEICNRMSRQIYNNHLNIQKDHELDACLNFTAFVTDRLLSEHALSVRSHMQESKQMAIEDWLKTKTTEERLKYIERHQ